MTLRLNEAFRMGFDENDLTREPDSSITIFLPRPPTAVVLMQLSLVKSMGRTERDNGFRLKSVRFEVSVPGGRLARQASARMYERAGGEDGPQTCPNAPPAIQAPPLPPPMAAQMPLP